MLDYMNEAESTQIFTQGSMTVHVLGHVNVYVCEKQMIETAYEDPPLTCIIFVHKKKMCFFSYNVVHCDLCQRNFYTACCYFKTSNN